MMHRRKLDIIGVSETKKEESKRRMIHDNYLYIGRGDSSWRDGVIITIKEELANIVVKHELINNRMVKICLKFCAAINSSMQDWEDMDNLEDEWIKGINMLHAAVEDSIGFRHCS